MGMFAIGSVVIALVSGYHKASGAVLHGIFALDRDGRKVRAYDRTIVRDDQGMAPATETDAAPAAAFERMIHSDRVRLGAAIIRKGPSR